MARLGGAQEFHIPDGPRDTGLPMSDFAVAAFANKSHVMPSLVAAFEEYDRQQMLREQVHQIRGALGTNSGFRVISPPPSSMGRRCVSTPLDSIKSGMLPAAQAEGESDSDTVVPGGEKKKSKNSKKNEKKKRKKAIKAGAQDRDDERDVEGLLDGDGHWHHAVVKSPSSPDQGEPGLTARSEVDDVNTSDSSNNIAAPEDVFDAEGKESESESGTVAELQCSPAESVRTEMTLVLGGDSDEEAASIVASPPYVSRFMTGGSANDHPTGIASDASSSLIGPTDLRLQRYSPAEKSAGFADLSPSPLISVKHPTPESKPQTQLSPERPPSSSPIVGATPTDMPLLTPESVGLGSFRRQNYPNPKTPAALMPTGTIPLRSVSHGRSPLAAAPPITPSTLDWPESLMPSRTNTPDSAIPLTLSGTRQTTIENFSSSEFVTMPESVQSKQPNTLHNVELNHAYTLFTSHSGGASAPAKGQAGSSLLSADLYSNDLVPIFTARTFGEFFGSWKALRRAVSRRYGRAIEAEGSESMVPSTEGLGIHLSPGGKTLQFFREGVKPMWEDVMCAEGGKIMLAGKSDELDHTFFRLVLSLIAGCFDVDCPPPTGTDNAVVGIVHSKREKHSRIEIWLGGHESPPDQWVERVETFLKADAPGQWFAYKSFHK